MRKRVFIAHQIRGDIQANLESAKRWCRWAIFVRNVNPIAPYLTLMTLLDERDESERALGLALASEYITMCEELWICGPVPGKDSSVWEEARIAGACGTKVIDYTCLIPSTDFH